MSTATTPTPKRSRPGRILLAALLLLTLGWLIGSRFGSPHSSPPVPFVPYPEPNAAPTTGNDIERPRNIILVVADGFGFAHLSLALHTGGQQPPVWHRFQERGWHDPRPIEGTITDSAASATAMATGRLTRNEAVGVDRDDQPLTTLFETAWERGVRTGIVTDSYIWDATPAAFATHTSNRDNAEDILRQLAASELDVLFGELEDVGEGDVPGWDETIDILEQRFTLLDESLEIPEDLSADSPIATVHPEDSITDLDSTPSLLSMVEVALERLSQPEEPFLLLIETEEHDSASHRRDGRRVATAVQTLNQLVEEVLDFAQTRSDTLLVVTSDHETGGLALGYELASYPDIVPLWSSEDHTATVVPLFADGPGAARLKNVHRVWQVGEALEDLLGNTNE